MTAPKLQPKPDLFHIIVVLLIYTPFLITFLAALRLTLKGFCYTLDVILHLLMIPFKIILLVLRYPADMCKNYSTISGKCPRRRRCKCKGNSRVDSGHYYCHNMPNYLRNILDN